MKTYYIYHIDGTKIGCTSNLEKRMADQGFTNWEIIETHTDIYIASEREIELQKQYGYKVDKMPYWQSVENRFKFDGTQRTYEFTFNDRSKGGKKNVESGHLSRVRNYSKAGSASQKVIYTCPICSREIRGNIGYSMHIKAHKKRGAIAPL